MKNFPKDEEAKKICWDWADDFRTVGMVDDCMMWLSIGFAFERGASVNDSNIITEMNRIIQLKIETSRMGAILPKSLGKALLEIRREAEYLKMLMAHTFS